MNSVSVHLQFDNEGGREGGEDRGHHDQGEGGGGQGECVDLWKRKWRSDSWE